MDFGARHTTGQVLAAGHDEVAGAFGTGFDQERGFTSRKPSLPKCSRTMRVTCERVRKIFCMLGLQIDVAVFETLIFGDFVCLVVVGQNGGGLGLAEHLDAFGHQFNGAGLQFVVGPTVPKTNLAFHTNAVFTAKSSGDLHQLAVGIFQIAHHLGESRSVSEIEEDQALALLSVGIGQPHSRTDEPASEFRRSPQEWVRLIMVLGVPKWG